MFLLISLIRKKMTNIYSFTLKLISLLFLPVEFTFEAYWAKKIRINVFMVSP